MIAVDADWLLLIAIDADWMIEAIGVMEGEGGWGLRTTVALDPFWTKKFDFASFKLRKKISSSKS